MSDKEIPAIFQDEYGSIAREFIDFINRQSGAYCDACAGFYSNYVRVERQTHRAMRPELGERAGKQIVVMTAVEDPSQPDSIHHRIILGSEFLRANDVDGSNAQHHARAAVVFIFAYWDEDVRPRLAKALGQSPNDIKVPIFGDLRILRRSILHNKGILTANLHMKLEVLKEHFHADKAISLNNEVMHRIFYLLKKGVARRFLDDSGLSEGAPFDPDEIDQVAIQHYFKPRAS